MRKLFYHIAFAAGLLLIASCSLEKRTIISNPPKGKPFVYDTKINVNGNITKDEKIRLTNELGNYWDDSIRVKKVSQLGIRYVIKNPAAFDSANLERSIDYMNEYLNSQGFYYALFEPVISTDYVKNQERKKIALTIELGKNITFDSIGYELKDSNLQLLTEQERDKSRIKAGDPYTKSAISNELDRLVSLYRQNGYFQFTREHIFAHVDTLDRSLFQLTLDPIKQVELIMLANKNRQKNTSWPVAMERRDKVDSNVLKSYKIGTLYYYPETRLSDLPDSLPFAKNWLETRRPHAVMRYKKGLFVDQPLLEHTYQVHGELYNEQQYFKTLNALGRLGAWQSADAKIIPRDKDTLDIHYFLVPAIKQSFSIDLEGSRNTTDLGAGNLWGLSTNLNYINRNVWKRSIQSVTSFRTGVELNILNSQAGPLVQTFHVSLGHTYSFPQLILPVKKWRPLQQADDRRTLLSLTGSFVNRRDFYLLRSLVASWGYEWKKKNVTWLYKPLNAELYTIERFFKLDSLLISNPFLQTSFNEGRVFGQTLTVFKTIVSPRNPNKSHFIRLGLEESGSLFALFNANASQIYRFIKTEGEYIQTIKYDKNSLAFRAFAGVGYNYGTDPRIGNTLPFFKQFFAGGPNSMRAWRLRQIGLGGSIQSDTISNSNYRDRFGDMQLEFNLEYRFRLTSIGGFKIESAVFTDIGNIWSIKNIPGDPEARFSLKRLGQDLAVDVGAGLRFDFTYFLIRLDAAYKVKDPARPYNNGWMNSIAFTEKRPNGLTVENFALQLGIGLPF
jgi:outer membrane protein assembly factor BamA